MRTRHSRRGLEREQQGNLGPLAAAKKKWRWNIFTADPWSAKTDPANIYSGNWAPVFPGSWVQTKAVDKQEVIIHI